ILDAVQQHDQVRTRYGSVVAGITVRRADGDHTLVSGAVGHTIQGFARLESHGDVALTAKLDDLLQSRTAGTARNQYAVERSPRRKRLPHRMHTRQDTHTITLTSRRRADITHMSSAPMNPDSV